MLNNLKEKTNKKSQIKFAKQEKNRLVTYLYPSNKDSNFFPPIQQDAKVTLI